MLRPAPDRRKKPMNKGLGQKIRGYLRSDPFARHAAACAAQVADAPIVLDETCSKPWGKLRLLTLIEPRKGRFQGPRSFDVNLGVLDVSSSQNIGSSGAVTCHARAGRLRQRRRHAGQGREAGPDVPFFIVIDNRVTYSYIFTAAQPGMFSVNPNGTVNAKTAKQVYSFTHFDTWAYGTNFLTISLFKSDHNDPASPCTNAGIISAFRRQTAPVQPKSTACSARRSAGTRFSTPRPSRMGPLQNISFEVGMDANTENRFFAAAKRDVVAGLQFNSRCLTRATSTSRRWFTGSSPTTTPSPSATRFSGPHSGHHLQCATAIPGSSRHGRSKPTTTWIWASCRRTCSIFSISGRAAWYGRRVGLEQLPCLGPRAVSSPHPRSNSTANRSA